MKDLTGRQLQVLGFIAETIRDRGFPPTIREIGNALGIKSTNGVNDHLKALERKGFIAREGSQSRAIMIMNLPDELSEFSTRPSEPGPETLSIPLLGRIAAGAPIEAIESAEEHIQVDPSMIQTRGSAPIFALRVTGDSMIGDGIFDGDIIFISKQHEARKGEIVAVMVDGNATVKRYYREGDKLRLAPSNPEMEDIIVDLTDAREAVVLGKVVGVYRKID
ncbi:MAG: repressor LexA [Bradymonadia bacterium]|jgi:repressor LexA